MSKKIEDVTNKRFGKLIALEISQIKAGKSKGTCWKCLCDCGLIKIANINHLKKGSIRSCGCLRNGADKRIKNLKNQKIYSFTILNIVERENNKGDIYWNCLCDCGKVVKVLGSYLREGTKKHCGCKYKNDNKQAIDSMYYKYRYAAQKRSLDFLISVEKFENLIKSKCYYCRLPPQKIYKNINGSVSSFKHNGIDRVNNQQGYTDKNCVPCCFSCNHSKGMMDLNAFCILVKNIYKIFIKNNRINKEIIYINKKRVKTLYSAYKNSAIRKKKEFLLDYKNFNDLISQDCFYCGSMPQKRRYDVICNGIDRLDNKLGYFLENCVPCCKYCNYAKNTQTIDEFKKWVKKIYKNIPNWSKYENNLS